MGRRVRMAWDDFPIEEKFKVYIFWQTGRNCIPGIEKNVCIQPVVESARMHSFKKKWLVEKKYLEYSQF